MTVAIPWHRRLEARVLAGVTAIVGISLAALTVVTGAVIARHTMARAEVDLAAAQAAFTHLVSTQSELVGAQTRLITGLPVFRAHMTDSRLLTDVATMEAMADMYREELDAAFTIVSDGDGRWLASPGLPADASRERLQPLVDATAAGRKQRGDRRPRRPPLHRRHRAGDLRRRGSRHVHHRLRARQRTRVPAGTNDRSRCRTDRRHGDQRQQPESGAARDPCSPAAGRRWSVRGRAASSS